MAIGLRSLCGAPRSGLCNLDGRCGLASFGEPCEGKEGDTDELAAEDRLVEVKGNIPSDGVTVDDPSAGLRAPFLLSRSVTASRRVHVTDAGCCQCILTGLGCLLVEGESSLPS